MNRNRCVSAGCAGYWPGLLIFLVIAGCTVEPEKVANLNLQKLGPQSRFLGRPAEYSIAFSNIGQAPASNVLVRDTIPSGMSYLSSNPPGNYNPETRRVSWSIGTLNVGDGSNVALTLQSNAKGQQCNTATVKADGGILRTARSCTLVTGAPELKLTILDEPDPLEVGVTTTYIVTVLNDGTEAAKNTRLTAVLPPSLAYVSSTGPTFGTPSGNVLTFAPLALLLPRQSVVYSVVTRAIAAQDSRFMIQLMADHLSAPILVQESTRIGPAGQVPQYAPVTRPRRPREGPTYLRQQDRVSQFVSVERVVVSGQTVSGRIVNSLGRPIRNVVLTIRSIWLWNNEYRPGVDDLSKSTVYRVNGQIPPGGSLPFSFNPLPVAYRSDGRYETKVFVSQFEEVP